MSTNVWKVDRTVYSRTRLCVDGPGQEGEEGEAARQAEEEERARVYKCVWKVDRTVYSSSENSSLSSYPYSSSESSSINKREETCAPPAPAANRSPARVANPSEKGSLVEAEVY